MCRWFEPASRHHSLSFDEKQRANGPVALKIARYAAKAARPS
jgi:hypothetical protein